MRRRGARAEEEGRAGERRSPEARIERQRQGDTVQQQTDHQQRRERHRFRLSNALSASDQTIS